MYIISTSNDICFKKTLLVGLKLLKFLQIFVKSFVNIHPGANFLKFLKIFVTLSRIKLWVLAIKSFV